MIMESIYHSKARSNGNNLNEQLKELNNYVVKFCVPRIMKEIEFYLKYLDDVQNPMTLNKLPESSANLRSVSALTSKTYLNENIYLPNMASNYYYSTNGDINDMTPSIQKDLETRIESHLVAPSMNIEQFESEKPNDYKFDWVNNNANTLSTPSTMNLESTINTPSMLYTPSVLELNSGWGSPTNQITNKLTPPTSSDKWLPSSVLFQDDPYYIRNSLLSPYGVKPRYPQKTFPNENKDIVSAAEGSKMFLPNNLDSFKYAKV